MNLPEINFVTTDKEAVEKEIFALYTSVTGRTLAPADPNQWWRNPTGL